jgi:CDP-diacylglycerol--glycerol-3-phosphate 3-phosphatidyltransferase
VALCLGAFLLRVASRGMPRTERIVKQGGTVLLGAYAMEFGYWMFQPFVKASILWRVSPDALSWASLVLQAGAAALICQGTLGVAAWLLILGAGCDALDGAVARARGVASEAGEILDAAVDRWAEMALFLAYAFYYRDYWPGFWLSAFSCMGSVMVSYARAKGEIVQVDAKMGLMQRQERAVYLAAATLFSPVVAGHFEPNVAHPRHVLVLVALALIAVLSTLTSIQRTAFTRAELRRRGL